jgi:hypothetical protein
MSLPDAYRALLEEIDLWPLHKRQQITETLARFVDLATQQLRKQRETTRRTR